MSMNSLSGLEQNPPPGGLVHLYVGDGKGKTTAAVGLVVRFLGMGGTALFCQFLKARPTGEIAPLQQLGAEVRRAKTSEKFFFQMDDAEKAQVRESHGECLSQAAVDAASGRYGLIVLDEVVDAVNCGAVGLAALLALLEGRHPTTEVVLSGRNPDPAIVAAADYYTEFVCRSHPYKKGIPSRPGVEY